MKEEILHISLTKNEALVFFEFLARFNQKRIDNIFEDQAEQKVLWDIECQLEKELAEPFRSDYLDILNKARAAVRDKE